MPLPRGTTVYNKRSFDGDFEDFKRFLPRELNIIDRAIKDVHVRSSRTVTAATTVVIGDYLVLADATASPFTVTLPDPVAADGQTFIIKRINGGGNAVTVASAANIDGAATYGLHLQYASVTVCAANATWWVV